MIVVAIIVAAAAAVAVGIDAGLRERARRLRPPAPRPWPVWRLWHGRGVPAGFEYIGDRSGYRGEIRVWEAPPS